MTTSTFSKRRAKIGWPEHNDLKSILFEHPSGPPLVHARAPGPDEADARAGDGLSRSWRLDALHSLGPLGPLRNEGQRADQLCLRRFREAADEVTRLTAGGELDGGAVLPGAIDCTKRVVLRRATDKSGPEPVKRPGGGRIAAAFGLESKPMPGTLSNGAASCDPREL